MTNNTSTEIIDDQTTARGTDDNLTEARRRRIRLHQATAWLEWARCAGADDES